MLVFALAILGIAAIALASDSDAETPVANPDPALVEWPEWPYRATCGFMGFDPVRVFSGPAAAEHGDGAPETALRDMLARDFPFPLPHHGWRMAARRNGKALFLHGRLGAEFESPNQLENIELKHRGGRWQIETFGSFCNMFTVSQGRDAGGWRLAPKQPPLAPSTERLQVITGARCSRAQKPPRVTPSFDEIAGKLVMTLWLRYPKTGGNGNEICSPGLPPWPPVAIELPEPLGDRPLYDGAFFPPVPAERYERPTVIPL
ncbi:MAG TPA: hypothetical protein VFB52_01615 [Solirubrobacterales bacterium]|nr:hypothetical protein [Solirubrobacterales bacterium]